MTKKQIFILTVAGHLAALVLLYLPFALSPSQGGYAFLAAAFFNLILVVVSFTSAVVVSVVPTWRPYSGAWWLGFGLLLLASVPVCFASMGFSAAI
ncbi:MAG: hypothetical protein JF615_00570 [Asticcacaulis sp.]|nr:hypothetical protein [Asticcacaulis sp.]